MHRLTGDAGVMVAVIVHGAPQVTSGNELLDDTMIESISRLALVAYIFKVCNAFAVSDGVAILLLFMQLSRL